MHSLILLPIHLLQIQNKTIYTRYKERHFWIMIMIHFSIEYYTIFAKKPLPVFSKLKYFYLHLRIFIYDTRAREYRFFFLILFSSSKTQFISFFLVFFLKNSSLQKQIFVHFNVSYKCLPHKVFEIKFCY